ncbi:MAG: hypothetical protein ACI87W_000141 [Halieaceae bacterium]
MDLNAGTWGLFAGVKYWCDDEQANGDVLHDHVAAEIGAVWLGGMDDDINYGRAATYGANTFDPFPSAVVGGAPISCNTHPLAPTIVPNPTEAYCKDEGFTTDFSWGYRIRASANYNSALAGANLTPSVAWSHDVSGYSPAPNFIEDRMALSLRLKADYQNLYQA